MKRKYRSHEQVIRRLRTAEQLIQGQGFADACRAL